MPENKISAMTDGEDALSGDLFEISREVTPGVWETFRLSAAALANLINAALTAGASPGMNTFLEVETALAAKAPKASPAFTDTPTAPTASLGTRTQQLATTAFVANERGDLTAPVILKDDFTFASTESGEIGELGWSFTNGTANLIAPEANHPGIVRRTSSAVAAAVASAYPGGGGTAVVVRWDQIDDQTWIVRPATTDADYDVRVGLFTDATANPPTGGVYIERLAADTNWYGVTRSGGTQTRSASLAAFAASWIKLRIRRIDATTVGFSVNGGAEVTQTSNIPGDTTTLVFGWQIVPTTTTARSMDIDAFCQRHVAPNR